MNLRPYRYSQRRTAVGTTSGPLHWALRWLGDSVAISPRRLVVIEILDGNRVEKDRSVFAYDFRGDAKRQVQLR